MVTNEELMSDKNATPQQIHSVEVSAELWRDESVLN